MYRVVTTTGMPNLGKNGPFGAPEYSWKALMPPVFETGKKCSMSVENKGKVLHNITFVFGDVWLCAGQSNMVMKLIEINNKTEELSRGNFSAGERENSRL